MSAGISDFKQVLGMVADGAALTTEQAEAAWLPDARMRSRALDLIAKSEHLEAVFDRRMPGAKTFGLSGAESFLVLIAEVLSQARLQGAAHAVVAGMHRGRSTQMALVFGKPLVRIVADSMGIPEFPQELGASSDSPYHLGWEGTASTAHGEIGVWVAPHPSHLSVVVPVAVRGGRGVERASGGPDGAARMGTGLEVRSFL